MRELNAYYEKDWPRVKKETFLWKQYQQFFNDINAGKIYSKMSNAFSLT